MGSLGVARIVRAFGLAVLVWLGGCAGIDTGRSATDDVRLYDAIDRDDLKFVQTALRARGLGVDQRIPAPGYLEGTPLITIAARSAALGVLHYLIEQGADVNARTPQHETPLMLAAFFQERDDERNRISTEKHARAARMLVEAGAYLENDPHYFTPLAYAAFQGHEHMVRYLLERGARVDGSTDGSATYVNTPLMMAAIEGHDAIVRTLLRAGANARIRVKDGMTATEFAMKYGRSAIVPLLRCAERLAPEETYTRRCE